MTVLAAALATLAGCTSWQRVETFPGWSLHSEHPNRVDVAAFQRAYDPAFVAVESVFGPFRAPVRVHAFEEGGAARGVGAVQEVPGIGRARVRAYHTRGAGPFGPAAGVYASSADPGTAVHELVHARIAEIDPKLPLWFEEGLACVLGDGFLDGDRWVVDGLACWPLRELRARTPDERELARLLAVRAEHGTDLRENVLVHFVGWAIVFDLYRETGQVDWRAWSARARSMGVVEARDRLLRTLAPQTEAEWLARLDDPDRGVRMATAKGLWKLRSEAVLRRLVERVAREEDPEVAVALSINALAAAGEREPPGRLAGRMWRTVWPVLRRAELDDPAEAAAVAALLESFRWRGRGDPNSALDALERFWAE
ncbi:MAG: HEAT repeat domain-containing protein [Planctomycetes bacterium]|nr:HEAT repeat domain-containing protein [Planctomycetota bacterium]